MSLTSQPSDALFKTVLDFVRKRNIPRAILRDIPLVGNTLEALVFGNRPATEAEALFNKFQEHAEVTEAFQRLVATYSEGVASVLTLGSGVTEDLLELHGDLAVGRKHIVKRSRLLGGSGVNYAIRLVNTGIPVFPVLSVGRDRAGQQIQGELADELSNKIGTQPFLDFVRNDQFLCEGIRTSVSTILVTGAERTIFTESLQGAANFCDFAVTRISEAFAHDSARIRWVMIGHVLSDSPTVARERAGELTKHVISTFVGKAKMFANFGMSQLELGPERWKRHLKELDIFQLSLGEVRSFFRHDSASFTLPSILSWFRANAITVVITLDKLGAVGSFGDGSDGFVFAWPFDIDVVDSTGAGDAFGAGLVATLLQHEALTFGNFLDAIKQARVWAAYACQSRGGATNAPDRDTLRQSEARVMPQQLESVQVKSAAESDFLLRLLDKAYP